jgi:hypothetical protein
MTLQQLEAIYKANLGVGELEALEAIYTQGYYDALGIVVTPRTISVVGSRPAPVAIVTLKRPDLR